MTDYKKKTLDYYNDNAAIFTGDTVNVQFTSIQDMFLKYLEPGSLILDFGCGSGRDSWYFMQKGFHVEATDGSAEMVKAASALTGISVKEMLFDELDETEKYDGIFACASILHVPYKKLDNIFARMYKAVKANGIIYVSFKYGSFEGYRNGRYFTDMNEERLDNILQIVSGLQIVEQSITGDVRPGRQNEKWLNTILRKI